MMGEMGVRETFTRAAAGADIAVIEGAMGIYDGLEGSDTASTAHVAKVLDAPVLLVVDAGGASRSVHAMALGYAGFDPDVRVAGVIFNRVGSPRHRAIIEATESIPATAGSPGRISVGSRHLGLALADEDDTMSGSGRWLRSRDLPGSGSCTVGPPSRHRRISGPAGGAGADRHRERCGVLFYYADLRRLVQAGQNSSTSHR